MDKINCPECGAANMANAKYCSRCGHQLPEVKPKPQADPARRAKREADDKKFRSIVIAVGIVLFCLAGYAVTQLVLKFPVMNKFMELKAAEINKSCPIMIDEYTRLDSASVMADNSFQFSYTLVQMDASALNPDTVRKYMEPGIVEHVRLSPDMKLFRDSKITIVYKYNDKNGEDVLAIQVPPDRYE